MQATIRKFLAVVAFGLAGAAATGVAHAGGVHWSIGINLPPIGTVVSNAPGYHYPPPAVVYAPPPVVYAPPPVVYGPAPVAYGPPVYYRPAPVVHGWHGKKHHHRHHRHGRDRDDHDDRRAWRHDHRYRY